MICPTGAANDRGDFARGGAERNVRERRLFGSRIAKGYILKLHIAPLVVRTLHLFGIGDFRLYRQHFVNSGGRCRRTRQKDEQHRNHQQREQNLHGVLQERDHRANLYIPVIDADRAEPENRHAGNVQHEHHSWHQYGHHPVHADGNVRQVAVRDVKALFLVLLAIKGSHDAHAGQPLVQNEIDFVQFHLDAPEERDSPAKQEHDSCDQDRHRYHQNPGQPDILVERQNDASHHRDRGGNHHIQGDDRHLLHLRRIVGGACNQRG